MPSENSTAAMLSTLLSPVDGSMTTQTITALTSHTFPMVIGLFDWFFVVFFFVMVTAGTLVLLETVHSGEGEAVQEGP